jgi:hypothetical protein
VEIKKMKKQFEQCDIMSITDVSRKCPNITNTEKASEDDQKNMLAWKRDNAQTAAFIASALNQPVADLVLTYNDAKDIWDKLVSVYEQSSIQRLSMLITEFFKLQSDPEMDIAAYVATVEKLLSDMNTELRRRGAHDIPIELLLGQILATEGPEYREFSNDSESLDDNRTTNSLLEKLCTIEKRMQTSTTLAVSSIFLAHA